MKKILFVEDESSLQKAVGDFLTQEGFEVLSALNGNIGLQRAREEKPDLILLDLILPQKDGFELLGELRNDGSTKDIPVIVLTNLESVTDIDRALELGARTYLVKSNYSLEDLLEKIKTTFAEQ